MLRVIDPLPGEPEFLDEAQLTEDWVKEKIDAAELPYYIDLERPEGVPNTAYDRQTELAERILSTAGSRTGFGHHEEIRRSMTDWAPDRDEADPDDPGYWRGVVFRLTPTERNFGRIEAEGTSEQIEKTNTILAWAADRIEKDVLEEVEQEQIDGWKDIWIDEINRFVEDHELRQFQNAPPETYNGWEQFDAIHDAVSLAYRGIVNGTDTVVAVFVDEDGDLDCLEFSHEEWEAASGNPIDARPNRHPVSTDHDSAYARLKSHLDTFDVEPPAPTQQENVVS